MTEAGSVWVSWFQGNIPLLWTLEGKDRDKALFLAGFAAGAAEALEEASHFTTAADFTFHDLADVRDWLAARAAAYREGEGK